MSKTYTVNKIDTTRIGVQSTKKQVSVKQVKIHPEESSMPIKMDVDLKKNNLTEVSVRQVKIQPEESSMPITLDVPKKNKLTEAQYQKKVEKKAQKEQVRMKEIEADHKLEQEKQRVIQEKLLAEENEAKSVAQKAYDDEYTIAWIEETTKQLAINRSKKVYDRVYKETLEKIRDLQVQERKVTFQEVDADIREQLLDDSDNEDELPVIMPVTHKEPVFKITSERLIDEDTKDFKLVSYKKKNQSKFVELLEKSKQSFTNEILTEKTLSDINKVFSKKSNRNSVTVNIDVTDDNLESNQGYNITKSGFLKNTNFMFSKYLGRTIQANLNIPNVFVKIKKDDETRYVIRFVEKQ
jgi:hypothetical protein